MTEIRKETDSLGEVDVPADKLWGAQTQRSLEHFSIGKDLIPCEMITAYATLKKAAANANFASKRLDQKRHDLIVQVCDEILAGQHHDMFPLHVWMTGSGTQLNMNANEVISNRCCQIAGTPLGSKTPVHPNDHVNMAQSSNDSFPSAMNIAAAVNVKQRLIPAVKALHDAIAAKVNEWRFCRAGESCNFGVEDGAARLISVIAAEEACRRGIVWLRQCGQSRTSAPDGLRQNAARATINMTAQTPPAPTVAAFTLAAAAGAVALAAIFGVQHLPAAPLIFLSAGTCAIFRRSLVRYSANIFLQPFCASLLAGVGEPSSLEGGPERGKGSGWDLCVRLESPERQPQQHAFNRGPALQ